MQPEGSHQHAINADKPQSSVRPRRARSLPSQAIPLPKSHVARTNSELQLYEDMNAAEWRDLSMFYRVVHGIKQRQQATVPNDDQGNDQEACDGSRKRLRSAGCHLQPEGPQERHDRFSRLRETHDDIYLQPCLRQPSRLAGVTLNQPFIPNAVLEEDAEENGGWSITGYSEEASSPRLRPNNGHWPSNPTSVPVENPPRDRDVDEEDVFDMEL